MPSKILVMTNTEKNFSVLSRIQSKNYADDYFLKKIKNNYEVIADFDLPPVVVKENSNNVLVSTPVNGVDQYANDTVDRPPTDTSTIENNDQNLDINPPNNYQPLDTTNNLNNPLVSENTQQIYANNPSDSNNNLYNNGYSNEVNNNAANYSNSNFYNSVPVTEPITNNNSSNYLNRNYEPNYYENEPNITRSSYFNNSLDNTNTLNNLSNTMNNYNNNNQFNNNFSSNNLDSSYSSESNNNTQRTSFSSRTDYFDNLNSLESDFNNLSNTSSFSESNELINDNQQIFQESNQTFDDSKDLHFNYVQNYDSDYLDDDLEIASDIEDGNGAEFSLQTYESDNLSNLLNSYNLDSYNIKTNVDEIPSDFFNYLTKNKIKEIVSEKLGYCNEEILDELHSLSIVENWRALDVQKWLLNPENLDKYKSISITRNDPERIEQNITIQNEEVDLKSANSKKNEVESDNEPQNFATNEFVLKNNQDVGKVENFKNVIKSIDLNISDVPVFKSSNLDKSFFNYDVKNANEQTTFKNNEAILKQENIQVKAVADVSELEKERQARIELQNEIVVLQKKLKNELLNSQNHENKANFFNGKKQKNHEDNKEYKYEKLERELSFKIDNISNEIKRLNGDFKANMIEEMYRSLLINNQTETLKNCINEKILNIYNLFGWNNGLNKAGNSFKFELPDQILTINKQEPNGLVKHVENTNENNSKSSSENDNLSEDTDIESINQIKEEISKIQLDKFNQIDEKVETKISNIDLQLKTIEKSNEDKILDIDAQLKEIEKNNQVKIDDIDAQLKEIEKTSDDKISNIDSQLKEIEKASDDKISSIDAQLKEIEKTSDDKISNIDSQLKEIEKNNENKINDIDSQLKEIEKNNQDKFNEINESLKLLIDQIDKTRKEISEVKVYQEEKPSSDLVVDEKKEDSINKSTKESTSSTTLNIDKILEFIDDDDDDDDDDDEKEISIELENTFEKTNLENPSFFDFNENQDKKIDDDIFQFSSNIVQNNEKEVSFEFTKDSEVQEDADKIDDDIFIELTPELDLPSDDEISFELDNSSVMSTNIIDDADLKDFEKKKEVINENSSFDIDLSYLENTEDSLFDLENPQFIVAPEDYVVNEYIEEVKQQEIIENETNVANEIIENIEDLDLSYLEETENSLFNLENPQFVEAPEDYVVNECIEEVKQQEEKNDDVLPLNEVKFVNVENKYKSYININPIEFIETEQEELPDFEELNFNESQDFEAENPFQSEFTYLDYEDTQDFINEKESLKSVNSNYNQTLDSIQEQNINLDQEQNTIIDEKSEEKDEKKTINQTMLDTNEQRISDWKIKILNELDDVIFELKDLNVREDSIYDIEDLKIKFKNI